MKFGFGQNFDAGPEDVLGAYTNPEFWDGVADQTTKTVPTILGIRSQGDVVTVELRYRLVVDLPREAAKFIDTSNVSWVETSEWDLRTGRAQTRFAPDQGRRLMTASASSQLSPSSGGTRRDVTGDLRVRIPLLGAKVERAIVEGIGDYLVEEAVAIEKFLA